MWVKWYLIQSILSYHISLYKISLYKSLWLYHYSYKYIGHQYRVCAKYKNQYKHVMAYGAWLKVTEK